MPPGLEWSPSFKANAKARARSNGRSPRDLQRQGREHQVEDRLAHRKFRDVLLSFARELRVVTNRDGGFQQAGSPQEIQMANPRGYSLSGGSLTRGCRHVLEQPGTTRIYGRRTVGFIFWPP